MEYFLHLIADVGARTWLKLAQTYLGFNLVRPMGPTSVLKLFSSSSCTIYGGLNSLMFRLSIFFIIGRQLL